MALLKWRTKQVGRLLKKAFHLRWHQWLLLIEAGAAMTIACITLKLMPFQQIAATWGEPQQVDLQDDNKGVAESQAKRVGWAVCAIAHHIPWRGTCLVQAIAARQMLRRRHVSNALFFGIKKDKNTPLQAHAWLAVGNYILTGKHGYRQFSVLSTFVDIYTVPATTTQKGN